MQDVQARLTALLEEYKTAVQQIGLAKLQAELTNSTLESQASDFWNDTKKAQATMRRIGSLQARIQPWQDLQKNLDDITELVQTDDASLHSELADQLASLDNQFKQLKGQLKLADLYDDHDAILSIHAGAGGTDAQDWTQMLLRMYSRWAEAKDYNVSVIEESAGEEAGLKSVTLAVDGDFAYGRLKGEHGVHRLVRLSPFNSDNLRQTSFAKVEVMPKIDQPQEVEIDDKDLKIDVYRSGGHGGQSVNTTDSAVRITHVPTGIVVAIQNERSQLQNKETALTILRSKLASLRLEQHQDDVRKLKGPNEEAAWGNQIRNYVLHPYKQVKDLRSRYETSNAGAVLDGDLDALIEAYLEYALGKQ